MFLPGITWSLRAIDVRAGKRPSFDRAGLPRLRQACFWRDFATILGYTFTLFGGGFGKKRALVFNIVSQRLTQCFYCHKTGHSSQYACTNPSLLTVCFWNDSVAQMFRAKLQPTGPKGFARGLRARYRFVVGKWCSASALKKPHESIVPQKKSLKSWKSWFRVPAERGVPHCGGVPGRGREQRNTEARRKQNQHPQHVFFSVNPFDTVPKEQLLGPGCWESWIACVRGTPELNVASRPYSPKQGRSSRGGKMFASRPDRGFRLVADGR